VNDKPVAGDDAADVSEDSAGDTVDVLGNDTDAENQTLTVTAVDTTGTTGTVTNNGTDVTYDPNGMFEALGAGQSDTDTFTYTVTDSQGGTRVATVTITVTGVNDTPDAVDDAADTDEDTATAPVDVLGNDTDAEGAVTVTSIDTTGTVGTVQDNLDGTVTYDPNGQFEALPAGQDGTDTFTYTVTDAQGATDTATVTITVHGVNDKPVAGDDAADVSEDSAGDTVDVLGNDTDAENQTLTVTGVDTTGTTGTVTNNGTDVTYDPNGQFEGLAVGETDEDTFTYTVSDSQGGTRVATVTITVNGQNDTPDAVDDAYQTLQDTQLVVSAPGVLANDTDADGDTLSVPIAGGASNGDVEINPNGAFTYMPDAGYTGPDSFTYTVDDGHDGFDTATVNITVVPPNAAPTADGVPEADATGNEDGGAINITLTGHDADDDDALVFTAGTATNGLVTVPANTDCATTVNVCTATVTYTPNANFNGTDSFTYTVDDGTVESDPATVHVVVNAVNDVPSFTKGPNQTVAEDAGPQSVSPWATAISKGPANESAQVLTFHPSSNNPTLFAAGPTVSPTGNLTYTPANNANGVATVSVYLTDDGGIANSGDDTSDVQQFTITVNAVNDTPDAVDDTKTTDEDTFQNISVLANDSDVDADTLTIQAVDTTGTVGTVTNNGDGTIKYNPAGHFDALQVGGSNAQDTFTYTINDGHGLTDTATVTVTITPVNDAPVAANETQTGLIGNTLHVVSTTATGPQTTGTGNLKDGVVDPDDSTFTVTAGSSSTNLGTVAVNSDGTYTFLPKAGYNGTDTFTFTIHDAHSGTDDATASMTVANMVWYVNSAAGAGDGRSSSPYNAISSINGAGGSGDVDSANDVLFLYQGSYTGGLPLESGQKLWGQPHGLNVASVQLVAAGGSNPNLAGGLALGNNTDVQGLTLGTVSSFALSGTSVGSSAVGTITAVDINNTGGGGINLNTGTPTVTLSKMVSTGGTNGLVLTNLGGTVTVNDTTSAISGTSATALGVSGGAGSLTYKGTVTSGAGVHSVSVANHTAGTVDLQGDITDNGTGITLSTNTGTVMSLTGKLTLNTGSNPALTATGGGTLTAPNTASTSTSTTGTGVNIANTTIGAAGVKFKSVSVNGAPSGIALNTTGSTGSFTVVGNAAQPDGGTIQNTTGHGIDLTNTLSPSFKNVKILNTAGQGVKGSQLTNFTFTNGLVDNSGTGGAADSSNIGLNTSGTGTEQNVTGVVTITGNTLTNAKYHGVDVLNYNGTIADLNVSSNTLTSTASTTTSLGSGIRVTAFGNASTVSAITKAEIQNNTITNFPMGAGIAVQGGNSNASGPAATVGVNGSGTNLISVTGNHVAGDPTLGIATQAILVTTNGKGQGNFDVSNNGTVGDALRNTKGTTIAGSVLGNTTATMVFNNNVIQAHNVFASPGIGVGTSETFGVSDTPNATVTITNNNVSFTEGQGILVTARDANGTLRAKIQNNTVAAPTAGVRQGIRVDSGNATPGEHETVCLNITGNTSAGSTVNALGIGLRRDSTGSDVFGINGMAAVTSTPGVEAYVNANNPTGGGTLLISSTSGFSSCSLP
jgi:VCBS repeat-containing protein